MFWNKKQPPKPEIDNESYERWLRAQRPDMDVFFTLDPADQEVMAEIGDAYTEDFIVGLASAIQNPTAAAAQAGDPEAEEEIATQLGTALLHRLGGSPGPSLAPGPGDSYTYSSPPPPSAREGKRDPLAAGPVTFGGSSTRQAARRAQDVAEKAQARTLFGAPPREAQ